MVAQKRKQRVVLAGVDNLGPILCWDHPSFSSLAPVSLQCRDMLIKYCYSYDRQFGRGTHFCERGLWRLTFNRGVDMVGN